MSGQEAFIFWGPFVGFAVIVLLYLLWMWRVEGGEDE
jgi:hypothetical protein